MSDYRRQQNDHECPPRPRDPADQPNPPGGDPCAELPKTTPPKLKDPEKCPPDPNCKCPRPPTTDSNCLEELISRQSAEIAAAEKAKPFKADLEALLVKAKAAGQDYTRAKFEKLVKQWVEQDLAIAELARKVACALPCWRCVIECYICPLLNDMRYAEQALLGDGTQYTEVHNLYDLQYWHTRDKEKKERTFNRIKAVLAQWEKPAATIEKVLADNQALADAIAKLVGTDPGRAVYDLFLRLIPMHLAIAPPRDSAWTTRIPKEYTEFCECDEGTSDDCCGPDTGELSFRQRLIGPQPYLIDPKDYFTIICCLVQNRYHPAKDALAQAEADWTTVDNLIKRYRAQVDNGLKNFEKDAKGAIPLVVDCCDHEKNHDDDDDHHDRPSQTRR